MAGGFDLNGRYYPNANDALNAEMAQCNEIDNWHNRKQQEKIQQEMHRNEQLYSQYIEELHWRVQALEERLHPAQLSEEYLEVHTMD